MSRIVFDASMSLDGFMTASNQTAEDPLGIGGLRLFAWFLESADERDREVQEKAAAGHRSVHHRAQNV